MKIREKILLFCRNEGITQQDFAAKIGLSSSQMIHLMNDRTKFNEEMFINIKKAFPQIDMNSFFLETENTSMIMEDTVEYGIKRYPNSELISTIKQIKELTARFE